MNYLRVPTEVALSDVLAKKTSWSAGMYRKVIIPNGNVRPVRELLDSQRPYDKGAEPGSVWYMQRSTHYFIRTKALQDHSYLGRPKQ